MMLPVCIFLIPYFDEKKWRDDALDLDINNNAIDDNSFLGGNKMLHRDTSFFNRGKSSIIPSAFFYGDQKSFKAKSFFEKDKSFMEKCKNADQQQI